MFMKHEISPQAVSRSAQHRETIFKATTNASMKLNEKPLLSLYLHTTKCVALLLLVPQGTTYDNTTIQYAKKKICSNVLNKMFHGFVYYNFCLM